MPLDFHVSQGLIPVSVPADDRQFKQLRGILTAYGQYVCVWLNNASKQRLTSTCPGVRRTSSAFLRTAVHSKRCLMASMGIEPTTFALLARRSNQLS